MSRFRPPSADDWGDRQVPPKGPAPCSPSLANRTYGRLFLAQIIALLGTGLLTVALELLAFALAGDRAGTVLGTALAIKMIAYVTIAPVVGAFAAQLPRKGFLIAMDLVRAAIALLFALRQRGLADLRPDLPAAIGLGRLHPDLPGDDPRRAAGTRRTTRRPSRFRGWPMIWKAWSARCWAAALLTVISYHWLFSGTVAGFLVSAALVLSVTLPASPAVSRTGGIYDRTTRGMRIYLATPRLRGLLALNMGSGGRRRDGDRQYGRLRERPAGTRRRRGRARIGLLRWRLDDRRARLATAAGAAAGTDVSCSRPRSVSVCVLAVAAALLSGERGKPCLDLVAGPAGDLAAARPGLFRRADAIGAAAASLGPCGGSTGRLRRAVRPVACLLAADLSAGRLARGHHAGWL